LPNDSQGRNAKTFTSLPSTHEATDVRERLLMSISKDAHLPALGSAVSKVVQIASSSNEAVHELAYFVLSDVALTQKILRLSNTVCYRTSSGLPVNTVSKAIFLLGFDNVKTSALAMILVDKMLGQRGQSVRFELAQALAASVIGREMARRGNYKDAEEAAIAALFKNIGSLVVASYENQLYQKISDLIESGSTSASASMQVIGLSYELLGETILREWQIPESIISALSPLSQKELKIAKSRSEWMQQVASFSATAAKIFSNINYASQKEAIHALLTRFGSALDLDLEKLEKLFLTVTEETQALTANVNFSVPYTASAFPISLDFDRPKEPLVEEVQMSLPSELLMVLPAASDLQTDQRHLSGKPINARDLLLAGLQDVLEMMAAGRCNVNELGMLILETLYRSMGFRFATICLRDIKTNQYRSRISLGQNKVTFQAGFGFSAEKGQDLFHLAIDNDVDLLISDASDVKIRGLIPLWHKKLLPDARSFIVLPLVVQKKPLGFLYADRKQVALEGVPPDETALIKTLKVQLITVMSTR